MLDPGEVSRLDAAFDGADQIDSAGYMIKGGGGALLRENILAGMADMLVIMADETKFVERLCRTVPVEVHPAARGLVAGRVREMDAEPLLRTTGHGYPAFTENGQRDTGLRLWRHRRPAGLGLPAPGDSRRAGGGDIRQAGT